MNRKYPPNVLPPELPGQLTRQLNELEGFIGLGMQKEALQLSRILLRSRPAHPTVFSETLTALLIHADRLRPWRALVERTYADLPKHSRNLVGSEMLSFYVSIRDWQAAAAFVPTRPETPHELVFTMWTLLNMRRIHEARPIQRKCLRLLRVTRDRFEASMLLDALADYHAQIGELDSAESYWSVSPPEQPLFQSAAQALVQAQAVRGKYWVAAVQRAVEDSDAPLGDHTELILPGNADSLSRRTFKKLTRYLAALESIVPEMEMWRFGVEREVP